MKLKHTTRKLNDFGRTLILALRKELKQQQHIASGNLLRSFKSPKAKHWKVAKPAEHLSHTSLSEPVKTTLKSVIASLGAEFCVKTPNPANLSLLLVFFVCNAISNNCDLVSLPASRA